jgi:hypothetical protein
MGVYAQYGLYLHPSGDEATLLADAENLGYYQRKGFTFLGYVAPPGTSVGPRDIDRNDSGVPAGPDGSTHDRHPDEVLPDGQLVPWGFPLVGVKGIDSTPRTASAMRGAGPMGKAAQQRRVRGILKDKEVSDEVAERIMKKLDFSAQIADPEDEMQRLHQEATLPGQVVFDGHTRGVAGMDVTMPSVVPGVRANDHQGMADAVKRGEVEMVETPVGDGGEVIMVPRAVGRKVGEGPEGEVTVRDETRQSNVRKNAQKAGDEGVNAAPGDKPADK